MGDLLPLLRGTYWGPIAAALVLQMASHFLWPLEGLSWVSRMYHTIWLETTSHLINTLASCNLINDFGHKDQLPVKKRLSWF